MYDDLADYYHLIFQDWDRSIEWQAGVLGPLIEAELPAGPLRILDCACGIGTQSLGLARRGHHVTGTDASAAAIARARREADLRGISIPYSIADMRDLSTIAESGFDAVLAADNALPHLLEDADLTAALRQIRKKLRPGGLFLATIRDYDSIVSRPPAAPDPAFFNDGVYRRIYHQVWDWTSARRYIVHLYLTRQTDHGWDVRHFVAEYRALLRDELTALLGDAGFEKVRWLMPSDGAYYQPVVLAR